MGKDGFPLDRRPTFNLITDHLFQEPKVIILGHLSPEPGQSN